MNNFVESFHYSSVPPIISTTEDDATYTSMMIESLIRGVSMESGGPSSFNVNPDQNQSSRPHCEYVGDFSEPEEYVKFDDSDDNNDSDSDVAANINVHHLSSTIVSSGPLRQFEPASHRRTLDLDTMYLTKFLEYAYT